MDVTSSPERQTKPKSLFNLCEQLVAENLDLVESFSGFPSLIGEKIFRSAIKSHKFSDHNYAQLSLKLFTEAFEEEVLRSLNLSKEHVGLNYYIEDFLMFKHLVEIDVSCCGLGDDHEILVHISALQRYCKNHMSCDTTSTKWHVCPALYPKNSKNWDT